MALVDTIRSAVKIADGVTKSLQVDVVLQHMTAAGSGVEPRTYAQPARLKALHDFKQRQVRNQQGEEVQSSSSLTFLDVSTLRVATRGEGISVNDLLTVAGVDESIINIGGFIDAGTGKPFASEVYLG